MGTLFNASRGQPGIPGGRAARASDFSAAATGTGMSEFGQAAINAGEVLEVYNTNQDLMRTYKDEAEFHAQTVAKLDEWKQDGQPVAERMQKWLDENLGRLSEGRTTQRGMDLAAQKSTVLSGEFSHAARAYDAALVGEEAKETVAAQMALNGNRLQNTPEVFQYVLDENVKLVDTTGVKGALRDQLLRQANADAARNAIRGIEMTQGADAAVSALKSGSYDKYLDPDARAGLTSMIEKAEAEKREDARWAMQVQNNENAKSRNAAANDAWRRLNSGELDSSHIDAMSRQTFKDGTPVFSDADISSLYTNLRTLKAGVPARTSSQAAVWWSQNQAVLTETQFYETVNGSLAGQISPDDIVQWGDIVKEGASPTRTVRSKFFADAPAMIGYSADILAQSSNYGDFFAQMASYALTREEDFKKQGKDPAEYYNSGAFKLDLITQWNVRGEIAKALDSDTTTMSVFEGPEPVKAGTVFQIGGEYIEWNGGSTTDVRSFKRVQKPQPAVMPPLAPQEVEPPLPAERPPVPDAVAERTQMLRNQRNVSEARRIVESARQISEVDTATLGLALSDPALDPRTRERILSVLARDAKLTAIKGGQ